MTLNGTMLILLAVGGALAADRYQPAWESVTRHPNPQWFDDAKFGIYFHWGVYSVPAFHNEWYARNMYRPGTPDHQHHLAKYGTLDKFGYKDFIPMFRAEKFNADEWADLFERAGARFAGPVAEHADGFAMWDSRLTEWNAARMGPRRDVVGEMARAIRRRNLKFITTFHHQWLYAWYPTFDKNTDASDPRYAGLYGPPVSEAAWNYAKTELKPPPEFCRAWEAKVREVIDKYQPDLLWFDSRLGNIDQANRLGFLAYYYNQALDWGREVGVTYKNEDLARGAGILDIERGRMAALTPFKWLNDDSIDWNSWCHVENASYKSADRLVDELVDIVSKNGNLLLNITPRADGTIPEPVRERLLEIGRWLKLNGEAIYGSRPWKTFGEGPTEVTEGHFGEKNIKDFTTADVRFTAKGSVLYAILMAWPENGSITIRSLAGERISEVRMLGAGAPLKWAQSGAGLTVTLPGSKQGEYAHVLRITARPTGR